MLGRCSTPGCAAIVFGDGTCVEHDPPSTVAEQLLAEARARAAASISAPHARVGRVEGTANGSTPP
jgi:hypothetical protein